jgi:hypothetical protein
MLPTITDNIALNKIKGCNSPNKPKNGPYKNWIKIPKIAIFGTIAKNAVIIEGDPS